MPSANELLDLISVHHFYVAALETNLGYGISLPQEVIQAQSSSAQTREAMLGVLRWLGVLDLAIAPAMVRDQLYATKDRTSAEALLRYFVKKSSVSDLDRDKADCVLGFLCRDLRQHAAPAVNSYDSYQAIANAACQFKIEINRILAEVQLRELPVEHAQLLREYEFLYQELIDFRTFDQLMDCGILGRIHNLKRSFGTSFYQPEVLAVIGVFNGFFGKRFDDLFLEAARHIKSFAARVQQEGTSIMSRIDGEVRLKHLTELEGEEQILDKEYGRAREDFEKISTFKKAVDKRRAPLPDRPQSVPDPSFPSGTVSDSTAGSFADPRDHAAASLMPAQANVEDYKFKQACEQIRAFVRAADPKICFTVPLPKHSLSLTPAEADAFRSQYEGEESFRARFADALVKLVTMKARTVTELLEFQQKQKSAYMWKPHADSLIYLTNLFCRLQEETDRLVAAAEQRGLTEKGALLSSAMRNAQAQLQSASNSLQSLETAIST